MKSGKKTLKSVRGMNGEQRLIQRFFTSIGVAPDAPNFVESLPFSCDDSTVGVENELQVAVRGSAETADLPRTILESNYLANVGGGGAADGLKRYIQENSDGIWENSQVRVPQQALSEFAQELFRRDLRADKTNPLSAQLRDKGKFVVKENNQSFLRIPVSYLLRLALADTMGVNKTLPTPIKAIGTRLLDHFLNDNTSPEQFSSYVVQPRAGVAMAKAVGKESAQRFLLTQLLAAYANEKFHLSRLGQEALVYLSALPPVRQRELNDSVSDSFYRELFMNPCLSGWNAGESKHNYMHLCHSVLSRSQAHAVTKLRDAGIVARNLIVVPNTSNISLANNGTHLSLGSKRLKAAFAADGRHSLRVPEKYTGDLTTKFFEHFLPLFVNTFSAAPYRLDFADFHPERVLSFLPHEVEQTHLKMLWHAWKKKADINIFKRPVTPFGLPKLDNIFARVTGLRGDFVPDYRLMDYFVGLLSTQRSPALDGRLHNGTRLKSDLAELGIFDRAMTLYLPYRMREFATHGYAGYEARYYSVFENFVDDFGYAAELQNLATALAYKLMANGSLTHASIPDDPLTESERRQFLFASAIGLRHCYVRKDTPDTLMREIVAQTEGVRASKFHAGYVKVPLTNYRSALIRYLRAQAPDLIELLGVDTALTDLTDRVENGERSAATRMTGEILERLNVSDPLAVKGRDFNIAAENYYRETLRGRHVEQAFSFLTEDARAFDRGQTPRDPEFHRALRWLLADETAQEFTERAQRQWLAGDHSVDLLLRLIYFTLLTIANDARRGTRIENDHETSPTPIHRTGNG